MKLSNILFISGALSLLAMPLASAQIEGPEAEPAPFDQSTSETALQAQLTQLQKALPVINQERVPVSVSWPIDAGTAVIAQPDPFLQESRQYVLDTTGQALARGVTIHTTAPGALVRVTPLEPAEGLNLQTGDIRISQGKNTWQGSAAAESMVDHAALVEAGADFGQGTIGFKLAADKGQGAFRIQLDNPTVASSDSPFVVHVFEPNSDIALELQAEQNGYGLGQTARFKLAVSGAQTLSADQLSGVLISPDGKQALPATFAAGVDGVQARVKLLGVDAWQPGLWELHSYYRNESGQQVVLRDAATAVALNPGTAHLAGSAFQQGQSLNWSVPVSARIPGRYDVRAVVYGTNSAGQSVPVAVAQSAKWLSTGNSAINLAVSPQHIGDGISEPFSLQQLQLTDQSRLARVDQR